MKRSLLFYLVLSVLLVSLLSACTIQDASVAAPSSSSLVSEEASASVDISLLGATEKEELWKKEEGANRTINIGYDGGICTAISALAQYKGYYQEEGLATELVRSENARDAIGAGKIDTASSHIASWAVPVVNGVKMTFVAGANTGCQSLYVLADSPVETTSDLIGKTIAVSNGIGNSSHNITLRFLGHDKLNPDDFSFVHVESSASILAMQNGEIDAITMADQYAKRFVLDGTLRVIRSITYDDDFKEEACCVFAINSDFRKENPITTEKLSRAYQKAGIWYESNKEEAVSWLLQEGWISGDYDYCLLLANELNFEMTEALTEETLRDVITDYREFGIMPKDKSVDELLNLIWQPCDLDAERPEWLKRD